jgi:O-acetylserine/cysteine efflux transporter
LCWRCFVLVALCNGALHFGFNHWAIQAAGDISSVALSLQSYIPMTAILAWWLLGERPTAMASIGIAVAFFGVAVLAFDPLVLDAPRALALSLIAAATLAVGTVFLRRLPGLHPFQVQAWSAVLGIPLLLAWSLAMESWSFGTLRTASALDWGGVAYSALAASLVGHGLLYALLQRHPIAQVTPLLMLTPVFAVSLGVLVWGDRPGPELLIGGALVLVGVLIVVLRGQRSKIAA